MQTILTALVIGALALGLLAMVLRPVSGPRRFEDADQDGEPDETPEEKRRALEAEED